jgi:ribonuclease-3
MEQLVALLGRLGLDPIAPGGPGAAAEALAPLEEALTHTSAGRPLNHEQLEFLGDAVLRLAATEFLARHHGGLAVGQRSALRAQLVSDRWLAEHADQLDLATLLHLGPVALGDASGRATVLAECCEALVGAIYRAWGGSRGGLEAVLQWLTPAWQQSSTELLTDPDRHNWKTALQEWSQGQGLGLPNYQCEEISRRHGDPRRFRALVSWGNQPCGGSGSSHDLNGAAEGWGGSRREAEQQAARGALAQLRQPEGS